MTPTAMPLLAVEDLVKEFPVARRPPLEWARSAARGPATGAAAVRAVDEVSFAVEAGEVFGLVGESGSGKTTTARCVLRLIEPTSGAVRFKGEDVLAFGPSRLRAARREMQMVFQDPVASLNPRMRVGAIVGEPLAVHGVGTRAEQRERVAELLRLVGLEPAHAGRRPHEFSGGQRQRIGIARALALNPSLLVADEPVSSLDVSIQAQVMTLLLDLRERLGLTYLLIAHDLRLVRHACTRLAVMYRGRIVERGPTAAVFASPAHPYTRALLSSMLVPDPRVPLARVAWDASGCALGAPLREVAAGHWAAV